MKLMPLLCALVLFASSVAHAQQITVTRACAVDGKNVEWMEKVTEEQYRMATNTQHGAELYVVAPALERYTQTTLADVWKRSGLSPRDRSLVTISVLTARGQTNALPRELNRALDNGLKPSEISEVITHLAFYSGWGAAMAAVPIVTSVFAACGVGADQLAPADGPLLPIDQASEAQRAAFVEQSVGPVAPGVVQYTSDPLFHELWLRPALAPRDRSIATVSALIASGQAGQLSAHLNRAMDNGLTQPEASEMLSICFFMQGGRMCLRLCRSPRKCSRDVSLSANWEKSHGWPSISGTSWSAGTHDRRRFVQICLAG